MKLRSLINLTEQAPVAPPMADPMGGAPVAAPIAPPAAMGQPPVAPPPAPDTSPQPEDPSEYDWTKDFREFEDAKNKAESEGKKKLLDTMNEKVLGKTIVANASRGYGQPKTDYTIEGIKKVSVEFWYKDYVVIVADKNDKKYFLTPGINIKIEQGGESPEGEPNAAAPEPEAGAEQPPAAGQPPPEAGQEQPNAQPPAPEAPPAEQPPVEQPPAPAAPQAAPAQPQVQPPQPPEEEPVVPPKKKKKMQEWAVQHDMSLFLTEFMNDSVKNDKGVVNFVPYLRGVTSLITESTNASKEKYLLEIPVDHMVNPLDIREVKLSAVDALRRVTRFGQYSKGTIEFNKVGRRYLVEYTKETGWVS